MHSLQFCTIRLWQPGACTQWREARVSCLLGLHLAVRELCAATQGCVLQRVFWMELLQVVEAHAARRCCVTRVALVLVVASHRCRLFRNTAASLLGASMMHARVLLRAAVAEGGAAFDLPALALDARLQAPHPWDTSRQRCGCRNCLCRLFLFYCVARRGRRVRSAFPDVALFARCRLCSHRRRDGHPGGLLLYVGAVVDVVAGAAVITSAIVAATAAVIVDSFQTLLSF